MDFISSLEKRFGSWAIPNLAIYIIAIQAIGVVLLLGGYADYSDLFLHGSSVLHRGQWWRLLSFMMLPSVNLNSSLFMLWLFFSFYIFYLMGSALERQWGVFRFNLFILSGYLMTVLLALLSPGVTIPNTYFLGSVFLAFATLFPNFEFHIMLIFPVKVKWLGWLTAAYYLVILLGGYSGLKLAVLAAFANYLLFFGNGFYQRIRSGQRRKAFTAERAAVAAQPLHVCAVCHISDKSDPAATFRYCSTCGECFCEKHIRDHNH